jgi:hypothetical protein
LGSGWDRSARPPNYSITITILVGGAVEAIRFHLHPELADSLKHPYLFAAACIAATSAIQLWTMSETLPKIATTAFFTQTSMASILLLSWKLIQEIAVAVGSFLGGLTSVTQ